MVCKTSAHVNDHQVIICACNLLKSQSAYKKYKICLYVNIVNFFLMVGLHKVKCVFKKYMLSATIKWVILFLKVLCNVYMMHSHIYMHTYIKKHI